MPPTDRGPSLSNSTIRNRFGSEIGQLATDGPGDQLISQVGRTDPAGDGNLRITGSARPRAIRRGSTRSRISGGRHWEAVSRLLPQSAQTSTGSIATVATTRSMVAARNSSAALAPISSATPPTSASRAPMPDGKIPSAAAAGTVAREAAAHRELADRLGATAADVARAAQVNAHAAQAVTDSAVEQSGATHEIATAATTVVDTADRLTRLVRGFRV